MDNKDRIEAARDEVRAFKDRVAERVKEQKRKEEETAEIVRDPEGYARRESAVDRRIRGLKDAKIRKKKVNSVKRKIAVSAFVAAAASIFAAGGFLTKKFERIKGEDYIIEDYLGSESYKDSYYKVDVMNTSNGYSVVLYHEDEEGVTSEHKEVSVEEGLDYLDSTMEYLSEPERCIVTSYYFDSNFAREHYKLVSDEDLKKAAEEAYHKGELDNLGKGVSR